jgi:hypothetical protein
LAQPLFPKVKVNQWLTDERTTARRGFGRGTLREGAVVWLRQWYPAAIAPMLSTKSDKTLLLQVETVEIRILLDYYPGPDSATEPCRKKPIPSSARTACAADAAATRNQ